MDDRHQTNYGLGKYLSGNIENLRPFARQYDVQKVDINLDSPVLRSWIDDFAAQILSYVAMHGGSAIVSVEQITAYLKYAIVCRVAKVVNDNTHKWEFEHRVPSLLYSFLSMVGYADSPELGIRLEPVIKGNFEVPTRSDLRDVAMFFAAMEKSYGFEMVKGLPRRKDGEWAFMSMEVVENVVMATTTAHHPQYAVVAAFFQAQGLATILGANAFRVQYVHTEKIPSILGGISYVRGA